MAVPGLDSTPEQAWLRTRGGPPRLVCSSYEVQLAAIRAGLGVGLAPVAVLDMHRELVVLEGLPSGPPLELFLVTRRAIRELPRIVALVEVLARELSALNAG
jgi:DNA-binding transcriptional LysR family regulator